LEEDLMKIGYGILTDRILPAKKKQQVQCLAVRSCSDGWRKEELTIASWNALYWRAESLLFLPGGGKTVTGIQALKWRVEAGTTSKKVESAIA
jgi:hypothetical protein